MTTYKLINGACETIFTLIKNESCKDMVRVKIDRYTVNNELNGIDLFISPKQLKSLGEYFANFAKENGE